MKSKKFILISGAVVVLGLTCFGVYRIWEERLWPFSTGTSDAAFLGTTFGMSPQEVRRSLAGHGGQLLNYEDYRKAEPEPSIKTFDFVPIFSDDRRDDASLYLSSIEMFDSKVEAEFSFRRDRLASVEVHIDPVAHNKAHSVVATVESKLRRSYQFLRREDSHEIAGAYTLHFTSASANPSLWVNLSKREEPIIILTVVHPTTELTRKREIQNRESKAFGAEK